MRNKLARLLVVLVIQYVSTPEYGDKLWAAFSTGMDILEEQ